MPVNPNVETNILPGTISAGGTGTDFAGAFITNDPRIPPLTPKNFFDKATMATFFGTSAMEYLMGVNYFGGVQNARKQPASYLAIRYVDVASSGRVDGASVATLNLAQLKLLTGTLIVTVGGVLYTSSAIVLSAATSFTNAASLMTGGFTTPPFTIIYDTLRSAFAVVSTLTGAAATMSNVTGTLADGVMLSLAQGAYSQNGFDADTDMGNALTRAAASSFTFTTFASAYPYSDSQRMQLAVWNKNNGGSFYAGMLHDSTAAPLTANNQSCFGNIVIASEYDGIVPVYNSAQHAATIQGYAAGLNMSAVNGRATIMYKKPVADLAYSCTNTADYKALVSNGYTFYAEYGEGATTFNHFANGQIGGQYLWLDSFLGQIYLRRLVADYNRVFMESMPMVPHTDAYYGQMKAAWQPALTACTTNGIIRQGVEVTDTEVTVLMNLTGLTDSQVRSTLETQGVLVLVRAPANVADRTKRTSPYCLIAYTDGQAVQQVDMTAYAVL